MELLGCYIDGANERSCLRRGYMAVRDWVMGGRGCSDCWAIVQANNSKVGLVVVVLRWKMVVLLGMREQW